MFFFIVLQLLVPISSFSIKSFYLTWKYELKKKLYENEPQTLHKEIAPSFKKKLKYKQ